MDRSKGINLWKVRDSVELYHIDKWGSSHFGANDSGEATVNLTLPDGESRSVSLFEIVKGLTDRGISLPVLLRFPDMIAREIITLNTIFRNKMAEYGYTGDYRGVYPIKVNQQQQVIEEIAEDEERLLSRPLVVSEEMRAFFSNRQGKGQSGLSEENYIERMSAAIEVLAEKGNIVFVGRGVQMILAGNPNLLHVHIYAPPQIRARRVMEKRGIQDEAAALQIIRRADERRRGWFRRFFTGANWKDPRYYHLMINTGRISVDVAIDLIVQSAREP